MVYNSVTSPILTDEIGIRELLDHDPRPTFALDLLVRNHTDARRQNRLEPYFCNKALRANQSLLDLITGDIGEVNGFKESKDDLLHFQAWAISTAKADGFTLAHPARYSFRNILWIGYTIRERWRLISGTHCDFLSEPKPSTHTPQPPRQLTVTQPSPNIQNGSETLQPDHQAYSSADSVPSLLLSAQTPSHLDHIHDTPSKRSENDSVRPTASFSRTSTNTTQISESTSSFTMSSPEDAVPDWTVPEPQGMLSAHLVFARSIDWASTPLGAMSTWSRELRQTANLVMSNPHPAALFWGHDLTLLYNEAYRDEIAGNKHPSLMGTGFEGPFREAWDHVRPIFVEIARTGKSMRRDNDYFPLVRHGYLEETYFSWSMSPLYYGGQTILGFYNAPFETTRDCISHRRMLTLQRLGNTVAGAQSVKQFWKLILLALEENHHDVPLALLYSVSESNDLEDAASISSGTAPSSEICFLEGSTAIPEGHPAIPTRLDLHRGQEGLTPTFREAMRKREPTRIPVQDGLLPESLLQRVENRGFEEQIEDAIIFPIRPPNGDSVLAFLLLGVNPRRAYDEDYQAFVALMNRQLATALASVLLFEDEVRRTQNAIMAATLEQEQLNEQLAVQTNRLQRMTALSPLGMFYINPDGLILEANDRYYEMTSQDREDLKMMGWMDQLVESSKPTMLEGWHKLTVDLIPWTAELQLKAKRPDPVNPGAEPIDYWVLASSQPELSSDGKLRSVMGSITDISHLKWAQGLQEQRLREAEERRRQQNEFIDITSHEMRNPLSAILQCADDIVSTMTDYQAENAGKAMLLVENCIESANTIAFCVQHQKSIVDDILTVSKLDSNLVELAPIPSQPVVVARGVMKMFEPELVAKNIKFSFTVNPNYARLGVDWVNMDPSRMSQILINLMTNAIKFTKDRSVKEIKMAIAVSTGVPTDPNVQNFEYIPKRSTTASVALGNDWDSREAVYIRIKVEDTGCGLTSDEKQLLFQRFQQASPRTHAQYGGSGLGLFISRQLTELHGGQIGVASEADIGSTFGFYIKARRIPPPRAEQPIMVPIVSPSPEMMRRSDNDDRLGGRSRQAEAVPESTTIIDRQTCPQSAPQPFQPIDLNTLNILVVEDNLVNQKVLMRQLQKAGFTVFVADHGQKALDFLELTDFYVVGSNGGKKKKKLSVVLMDLEMPVMDGLTCVRNIRRLQSEGTINRHVPVIAVTANVRHEQILAAQAAGMDDVVSKPFRIPDLLCKINNLLVKLSSTSSSSPPSSSPLSPSSPSSSSPSSSPSSLLSSS